MVVAALSDVHIPQCRNDLRATGKPLCLLTNFGRPKVEIRRVTRPSLTARTIPFIRLHPAHPPSKREANRHLRN
jgi:hypothetical protein